MTMPGGGTGGGARFSLGEIVPGVLKGIRSEILLYGIAVIIVIVGSAHFGIAILRELEVPLLLFATFVLVVHLLARAGAEEKAAPGAGDGPKRP